LTHYPTVSTPKKTSSKPADSHDLDEDRRIALLTAPSLGALDEAACQAVAAVLRRQRMEIANLAETHST
jgi:hypothetical protein